MGLALCKGIDDVPQRQQPLVDVDALLQAGALGFGPFQSLAPGQIHKVHLCAEVVCLP